MKESRFDNLRLPQWRDKKTSSGATDMKNNIPRRAISVFGAGLLVLAAGWADAQPTQYVFTQDGFQDMGIVTGDFTGEDLNGDGRIVSFDGEVSDFHLSFNGNSIVPAFSHASGDLFALSYDVGSAVLGDGGTAGTDQAEGLASNWIPGEATDLVDAGLSGFSFAQGMGPLGEMRAEIMDLSTGARLLSVAPMNVSASAVPEPASALLMALGLLSVGLVIRGLRRPAHRYGALAGLALSLTGVAAQAQTAVIWQQGFASGLGQFTPAGTVSAAADGAHLTGSAWGVDGAVTSPRLSTMGFTNVSLSFDRSCLAGLDATEGAVAEYAINGGAYTRLELARDTALAHATFTLAPEAANASLVLRFRINANASTESCTVNNVALAGTPVAVSSNRPAIGKFVTFESGQVRPLALSANGQRLYAVNTPDNRVEVFDVAGTKPVLLESIPVGLEPVALALAPDGKLWVVNHLSDSISIVDVSAKPARLVNTLLVGDEPRDIVFAGAGNQLAFITAAHRGQNVKFDPQLTTPGLGRADVWVFNTASPGTALGGTPVTVLNMFGDTLRALARNADGSRVYAAVLNSGNKTTVLDEDVANGGLTDKAPPFTAADGITQPLTGLIVQKNASGDWVDSGDAKSGTPPKKWNTRVKLDLPDYDVFTIDTTGSTPTVIARTAGVGTTLFNMAVNPVSGKLYVSNQEALNINRFEGPGTRSSTVRGHFVESRITVVDGSTVLPRHLNKHITSYGSALGTAAEKAAALATPLEMAVTPDGSQLYLVAMGSDKLARLGTAALESNTFTPSAADQLVLTGGGPTGLLLDQSRSRAYVLTRFDNGISVVNTGVLAESAHVRMFNPEPAEVVKGRRFLYDARLTSSRGDSSCAGCHVFADMDQLAWDLGNPDGVRTKSPNAYSANVPTSLRRLNVHPMKGPMTTQSLRGLEGNGPMHWRGDRTGANRAPGETLEERAFKDFNVAFTGLLGRDSALTDAQITSFAKYAMNLSYPPNPVASLDNALTTAQAAGFSDYDTVKATGLGSCNSCHVRDISKNRFGTAGLMSFEGTGVAEDFKIPHLRNMYQKIGMFSRNRASAASTGEQIRGFGFDKSGGSGSVADFLTAAVFTLQDAQRTEIELAVLAMPSNLNPVVGQQVTVTQANAQQADVSGRLGLLVQRALVSSPRAECELVAKGVIGSEARGWVMNSSQGFVPDRASEAAVTLAGLLSQVFDAGSAVTFTCVPPGNGTRIGIDRDSNTVLDRN
jgi:DNA-binding beta-propeller fold protein YncE